MVGPETMSKGRFIFMSLLPSIVFGFIPFILCMLFPALYILGAFGALSIAWSRDFYNVYNAATQMPRVPERIYTSSIHIGTSLENLKLSPVVY